ncbi:MAG TPA: exosortase/archaeosortase family protein [Vicinamibacterales bacterium]|nr:exosortase/archaeosortase family protein [Vicinamibacterales bacterium]
MVVLLALAVGWVYAKTAAGLVTEWFSSPDASYGLVLLSVAAVVAWQRRTRCRQAFAAQRADDAIGVALLTCALLLYLAGQLGADVFLTRLSLVSVLAGSIWFVAGAAVVRVLTAPLAFVLMAVPLPTLFVNTVTLPLQFTASRIAEGTLAAAGVPVFRDGNLLELPSATLEVAEACSGLRSLVSLIAIAVLLAWSARASDRPAARRTLLVRSVAIVAAAVPVAIVMNGLRIAGTGVACEMWGRGMASGAWHTFSGWVTFVAAAGVLIVIQRLLSPATSATPAVEGAAAA